MGRSSKWDATPLTIGQTPNGKRSRWDETPADKRYQATNTVACIVSPFSFHSLALMTPGSLTKTQQEMVWRNKPLTDADLDRLLPPGYEIVPPPASYVFFSFGRSTSRNLKTTTQPISLPLLLLPICLVLSWVKLPLVKFLAWKHLVRFPPFFFIL